jgi:hypothetical protein
MEVAGHVLRSSPIFFLTVSTYCPWTVVVLYTVRRAQCTLPPVFTTQYFNAPMTPCFFGPVKRDLFLSLI